MIKKIIILSLIALMLIALPGCQKDSKEKEFNYVPPDWRRSVITIMHS